VSEQHFELGDHESAITNTQNDLLNNLSDHDHVDLAIDAGADAKAYAGVHSSISSLTTDLSTKTSELLTTASSFNTSTQEAIQQFVDTQMPEVVRYASAQGADQ
jgi:hypothetical protein